MAASPPEPPSTAEQLRRASRDLDRVADSVLQATENLKMISDECMVKCLHYVGYDLQEFLTQLCDRALALSAAARTLCKSAEQIVHTKAKLDARMSATRRAKGNAKRNAEVFSTKPVSATLPGQTTFSLFPCLPTELQEMIWIAAARPPPCTHYFATFSLKRGGRDPAAVFLDDHGLWTACRESRRAVRHVYRHSSAVFTGAASCQSHLKASEMQNRRLGRYNQRAVRFRRKLRLLQLESRHAFQELDRKLQKFIADRRHPFLATRVEALFGIGPGEKLSDQDTPARAVKKIGTNLKELHLS